MFANFQNHSIFKSQGINMFLDLGLSLYFLYVTVAQ